jgi:hypothetical protein
MTPDKIHTLALKNCAKRLFKCIKLKAPTVVLFNEARRLFEYAKLLSGGEHYARLVQEQALEEVALKRNSRGFCATLVCNQEAFEENQFENKIYCCNCYQAHKEQQRKDDEYLDSLDKDD